MRDGWKDPAIPARQRALVDDELDAMYRGNVVPPYRTLAEALGPVVAPGDRVLEVGCASGYYSEVLEYLLGKRLDYTGVDYSPAFVELARREYPRARFEVADGAALPFADGSQEVVVSSGVLLHVTNWQEHVAEAARVARRWVVAHRTPVCRRGATRWMRKEAYGVETVELRLSEAELLDSFARAGLRLVRALELSSDAAGDEHWITYVLARPGVVAPLA
jgi:ubiquinone/menaquinone biosynthesis C-methylase UbiE